MYHAPVSQDEDRDEHAEAVEPVFADAGSARLRDAHLHQGQVEARAMFAPYLAVAAIAAAAMCGWALYGAVRLEFIIAWMAVVTFANWAAWRRVMLMAALGTGRTAQPQAVAWAIAEAMALALIWASLPTYAFATQPPDIQFVIGGAMAGMICWRCRRRPSPGSRRWRPPSPSPMRSAARGWTSGSRSPSCCWPASAFSASPG
jgi:hypothetical protein